MLLLYSPLIVWFNKSTEGRESRRHTCQDVSIASRIRHSLGTGYMWTKLTKDYTHWDYWLNMFYQWERVIVIIIFAVTDLHYLNKSVTSARISSRKSNSLFKDVFSSLPLLKFTKVKAGNTMRVKFLIFQFFLYISWRYSVLKEWGTEHCRIFLRLLIRLEY